jgi:hypothetical protein
MVACTEEASTGENPAICTLRGASDGTRLKREDKHRHNVNTKTTTTQFFQKLGHR